MRWLDIIQLRFARGSCEELSHQLMASLTPERDDHLVAVRIFHNTTVGNDLAVHLVYESPEPPEAELGRRLAAELEAHGLTDRSRWVLVASTATTTDTTEEVTHG